MIRNYNSYWDSMMRLTDPIGDAIAAYNERCVAAEEAAEAEADRPVCSFCDQEIDPADGCYEIPVRIRGRKEELLVCDCCYNTGFEGGTHYDSQDVREFLMEA